LPSLVNLEILELEGTYLGQAIRAFAAAPAYKSLRRLILGGASADFEVDGEEGQRPMDSWLLPLLDKCPNVEELSIPAGGVDANTFGDELSTRLRNVRSLRLQSTNVTGVTLRPIVERLPRLEFIDLRWCENLSGDAVQWARSKGVRVIVGQHLTNKERKVRYE
jgi:hypothetical protein